ncbi:MAG: alpha/beta hydrolase [Rhodocyclales bacterium]|nr:alpha/beta hydrolase [Rhodocyclales bacterium]
MSTWVFLRGLTREARHWGEFPSLFRAEVPGADVVAVDLPGNGRLHRLPSPQRIEDTAEWVRAELSGQGLRPPYHLLGLSLGAMVAVAWAMRHPEELRGGVLINTSLRPFCPVHRRLMPRNYPALSALFGLSLIGGDAAGQERRILRLTSACAESRQAVLAAWTAYRREQPVSRLNALRQLVAAARYRAPAGKPAVPLLVLTGAADRLVDPRCSRRLAACWGASFAVHPDAGHDLPLDDGPWVARQVRDWLAAPPARPL